MTESESVALPLGDAAIFSTSVIITERLEFVNTKMKNFPEKFSFFSMPQKSYVYAHFGSFAGFLTRIFYARGVAKWK